ncbi:MAG: hypothetical protein RL367_181 [Pseudomonadota bacterium]
MLQFNPYDPAFNADPYPVYARMRAEAPVYYNPAMNHWVLSRYDDVIAAHLDEITFTSKYGVLIEDFPGGGGGPQPIIQMPEPEHGLAKRLVGRLFGRPRMNALDLFIRKRAVELLEQAAEEAGDGEFDFVSKVTVQLPLDVISELLGIPEDLRDHVHHLCNGILIRGTAADAANSMVAMQQASGLFIKLAQERRTNPRDDVISMLIADEIEDEDGVKHRLSDLDIAIRFVEMALAGHETVAKALPNGAMAFQKFPEQRRKLMEDRSLLTNAADEILRYDPPSQFQGRKTTRDVTLHGVMIPEGSRVILATGSASRDTDAFPDADQFDITRPVGLKSHYFGYGVHKCLGIHLARQEIAIAIDELFTRFPEWEVDPDRVTRLILTNVRGVATLPMRLGKHA